MIVEQALPYEQQLKNLDAAFAALMNGGQSTQARPIRHGLALRPGLLKKYYPTQPKEENMYEEGLKGPERAVPFPTRAAQRIEVHYTRGRTQQQSEVYQQQIDQTNRYTRLTSQLWSMAMSDKPFSPRDVFSLFQAQDYGIDVLMTNKNDTTELRVAKIFEVLGKDGKLFKASVLLLRAAPKDTLGRTVGSPKTILVLGEEMSEQQTAVRQNRDMGQPDINPRFNLHILVDEGEYNDDQIHLRPVPLNGTLEIVQQQIATRYGTKFEDRTVFVPQDTLTSNAIDEVLQLLALPVLRLGENPRNYLRALRQCFFLTVLNPLTILDSRSTDYFPYSPYNFLAFQPE